MNDLKTQNQWHELRSLLEEKMKAVQDEILHYPPPIPACDQQFNYLLEQRALLGQAVQQLVDIESEAGMSLSEFAKELGCLSEGEIERLTINI